MAWIARDLALAQFQSPDPSLSARLLFDGRQASTAGATFANAAMIDSFDALFEP